ncbi:YchJ family protein [Halomonas sp. MA07-2]|uniref:YchJ family protein n=1 Tax=Halomonas sp. MA07-2 TaxID=3440841 RepID=UPI003EE9BCDA
MTPIDPPTCPCPCPCPCGSGRPLAGCCGRFHAGEPAPTPEALMRSRYSAFVLDLADYLLATWHPSTRPSSLQADAATTWTRLEVLESREESERGWVHFRATFRDGKRWSVLEESSGFVREAGRWFYLEGNPAVHRLKPGRNAPCPCGSGGKFKACCGHA